MYPDRFGPYVLVQPLGEGGMGKVALALCDDGGRERICVVKRLHAKYLKDPRYRQRFDDEAALSRRLSHPNLVDTLAAGEVDGEPFIAQGFVDGRDLSEFIGRIRSQRIQVPVSLWIHIVHQVAQGLAYAHDFENLGLVHRDINPPNIRIGFSGEVKLLDFGLAKWKDKSSQTVQGSLLGKTAYISPEQLKNEPPDRRSDLYVLGIVLWELLAGQLFGTVLKDGRLVYAEGDRSALARLFSPVVVPPSQFAPSVTAALDDVVVKSLALAPADRYQTAAELADALAEFLPADFVPAKKLAELMRLGFASEIETKSRQAMIDAGRALLLRAPAVDLAEAKQEEIGNSSSTQTERKRHRPWAKMAILLGAVSLAVVFWIRQRPVPSKAPASPPPTPLVAAHAPVADKPLPTPSPSPAEPPPVQRPPQPVPAKTSTWKPSEGFHTFPRSGSAEQSPATPTRTRLVAAHPAQRPSALSQAALVQQAKDSFSEGNLDQAMRFAQDALAERADADAWIVVGNVAFKRRAYGDAAKAYAEVLRLQPENEKILKRRQMAQKLAAGAETTQ
jgi:serine/threonine-protein kinase